MMLMVIGTMFCISSSHWIGVWAGLEINLLGFIPLMVYKSTISEIECGVKYFIIQSIGSGLLLFSSLFNVSLFLSWGNFVIFTYNYNMINLFNYENFLFFFSAVMFIGLLIKLGLSPFHFWLPSVMSGLSWMAALFLVTWQKVAPLFLLIMVVGKYSFILLLCCMFSSLVGGIGGLNQTQLRILLAYSSINHLGWMVASGICSIGMLLMYFFIYFVVSFMLFYYLWLEENNQMRQLSTVVFSSNINKLLFSILILSLGGFPPLLGFVGKWLVMTELFVVEPVVLFFLIMGSLISLFYYLFLFYNFFFSVGMYYSLFLSDFYSKKDVGFIVMAVFMNLSGILSMLWFPLLF
nr:NADH dehydrogenase subunit 2 [Acharax sp. NY-2022]